MNLKNFKNQTYWRNAFTLAEGGRSPLLYGDEGVAEGYSCVETKGHKVLHASKNMSFHIIKKAFTLSEVLITLGVIGVVAAVTMPTLIKNYQKKQTAIQLKKAYSELSQAISMAQKDNGMIEDWDFASFSTHQERNQYFYDNALKPNLKIVKYCAPSSNDCWADDSYTLAGTKYTTLNNAVQGRNSFITASGYSVYYWLHGVGTGGWFFVDLNGKKKPNMLGKDIFVFTLVNKIDTSTDLLTHTKLGFYPHALHYYPAVERSKLISGDFETSLSSGRGGCSMAGLGSPGLWCAALIMVDGWEIKDDYPW